jgi:hypothetical protein
VKADDGRDTVTPLELTRLLPYVAVIKGAVHSLGCKVITPWLLAAIGFRETHFGFAPGYAPKGSPFGLGDGGHGFGLWQLDDRSNLPRIDRVKQARAADGDEAALKLMAREALYVLVEKYAYMIDERRPRPLKGDEARRAMIAAYNAGQGAVYARIRAGQDPDVCTADGPDRDTKGDYSAWVLAKEAALQKAAPDLFGPKGKVTQ